MRTDGLPEGMLLREIDGELQQRTDQHMPYANIWEDDGIPSDAFHVMTMVGSDTNPELLRSARFVDLWQTASIPQVMELLPNIERVPYSNDPRVTSR